MPPQAILYGHILGVLTMILGGIMFATQWVAAEFAYDAYLGPAWFMVGETPVYYPWRLFEWWYAFHAYSPQTFQRGGQIVVASTFLSILFAIFASVWRGRQAKKLTTFGSSE